MIKIELFYFTLNIDSEEAKFEEQESVLISDFSKRK